MTINEFSKMDPENTSTSKGEVEIRQTNRQPSALVKAASVRHSGAAPLATRPVAATPAVAQSAGSSVAESPSLLHFFLCTFNIRRGGNITSEVVEVPYTPGINPKTRRPYSIESCWKVIQARYPELSPNDIRRTAGRFVSRPGGKLPVIQIREGETIRQLFPDKSEFETGRQVGTVMFDGALCDVILRHIRSKSVVSITLRQPGGVVVNFSAQYTTMQLVTELPKIIEGELEGQGTDLKLFFQKV